MGSLTFWEINSSPTVLENKDKEDKINNNDNRKITSCYGLCGAIWSLVAGLLENRDNKDKINSNDNETVTYCYGLCGAIGCLSIEELNSAFCLVSLVKPDESHSFRQACKKTES